MRNVPPAVVTTSSPSSARVARFPWVRLLLHPAHSLPAAAAPVLVGAALAHHNNVFSIVPVVLAASGAALAEKISPECRLVMVELSPGVDVAEVVRLRNEHAPQATIVAFGPHVDEQTLAAAQAAGADLVLSRGQFHRQYAELLRQAGERD